MSLIPAWCADSALQFRKTFGGSGNDYVTAIATDPSGYVIVGGSTSSYDFPVTDGSRNAATQFGVSGDSGGNWQPFGNLPKGTPVALAVSAGTWYAGGSGGIFKSTDGGATWALSLDGGTARLLAPDPSRDSTVYAIFNGAIVKTTDAGATWAATASAMRSDSIAVDPFFPDHIFSLLVGTGSFHSFDGGQSWTQYSTRAPHPEDQCQSGVAPFAFDRVTPGVAYMADHCNLFRSTDAGVSWSLVATPFELTFGAMATTKSGALYVVGEDGLYRSGDQGATWTRLLASGFAAGPRFVVVDPARPSVIVTDTMRSTDGGATWSPLALGRLASAAVFDPGRSGRLVAATEGASSGFLAKLDSAGTILAATYLGGQGGAAIAGVAAGADGRIYVTGNTASRDFPVTAGAWITTPPAAGYNYFAAAFDADLKPVYGTYLRAGIGYVGGIAVDGSGNAVVGGSGTAGPSTQLKCLAIKLKSDGSGVLFDRAFGGSNGDLCTSVAADGAGNSIVAGNTFSADFPVTGNSALTHWQGDRDAIVAKLDADGNLVFSGYLGGTGADGAWAAATDGAGNVYIAGNTGSKNFPVTSGAYQTALSSQCPYPSSSVVTGLIGTITSYNTEDVFLTKLDPGGNLTYSTYLGGGCYDVPTSIAVDRQGNVWITGTTNSDPFPQVMAFETGPRTTYYKAFISELDASGGSLRLSSYLTAGTQPVIAVDGFGDAYVGGSTTMPQSPYGGLPAPPPVITGVHGSLTKVQPQFRGAVAINSVGNEFTLRSGPVSAGQITLIAADGVTPAEPQDLTLTPSAALPRTLAETQVLFDGEPAALVSVAAGRVVAIAPYDLAGKAQTRVQVVFQGTLSAPMVADVAADVGYLSADGTGAGQAYARNADGTLNSVDNPAAHGSAITLYATGIGSVASGCAEGGVASGSPAVGGFQAVAGAVCGMFQTMVQTPTFATSSMTIPNTALTIAVK